MDTIQKIIKPLFVTKYPPYFLQTKVWTDFWLEANTQNHNIHNFSFQKNRVKLDYFIYEYPWQLGQKFWYLPKGPALQIQEITEGWKKDLNILLQESLIEIKKKASHHRITFLKIDLEYQILDLIQNNKEIEPIAYLKKYLKSKISRPIKISTKTIQYLQTITLDLEKILDLKDAVLHGQVNLQEFYTKSAEFWSTTNQKIRRYTRKSLDKNWQISTDKTDQSFNFFWEIYNLTKDKHNFAIQPKAYLYKLFKKDFSRIIILSKNNKPQGVWFGICSRDTLTYLYGGNTKVSLEDYGQYLIHLVATRIAVQNNLRFYDLGGYDPNLGFGKFKEGYRGEVRTFVGPLDIVFFPAAYKITNSTITLVKKLKKVL